MPPQGRKRRSDSYESDNGFVAGSDDDGSAPKTKKPKTTKAGKMTKGSTKGNSEEQIVGGGTKGVDGEEYWELSDKRRVVVSKYGKNFMVSIREYYEKDGKMLPGKKGISMPVAQFGAFVSLLPHIETVLKEKGETIPRPEYNKVEGAEPPDVVQETAVDSEEEHEETGKKNFEQTSDED